MTTNGIIDNELRRALRAAAAFGRDRFVDDRRVDEIIVDTFETDEAGRRRRVKELVEVESAQPINFDLPEETALIEMGCEGRRNEVQRWRAMDRADFTERCIVVGGRLYALYEKRRPDIDLPAHLRPEVLRRQIEIHRAKIGAAEPVDFKVAFELVKAFRELRLPRDVARRIVHGYLTDDLEMTSGIKAADNGELAELAEVFGGICRELAALEPPADGNCPRTLEDERQYWYNVSSDMIERGQFPADPYLQMLFIERSALRDFRYPDTTPADDVIIYTTPDVIEGGDDDVDEKAPELDAEMEATIELTDTSAFSAHPLYDETSGMSEEWITMIHEADMSTLSEEKRWLMSNESRFLTKSQRAMAWDYIRARERRLIEETLLHGDELAQTVARAILDFRRSDRQLAAMLFSWQNGVGFELGDRYLAFDERRPSEAELACAWQLLRRRDDILRRATA